MKQSESELATISAVAQLLAVVLVVAMLYFAKDVFIPLALGLLLSFLLSPIVNRLQRKGIPNVLAVVSTAALAFILLAGLFTVLGRELTTLVEDLPKHKHELITKARGFAGVTTGVGGELDELAEEVSKAIENEEQPAADESAEKSVLQRWTNRVFPAEKNSADEQAHDGTTPSSPIYIQEVKGNLPLASWATTAGTVLGPLATAGLVTVFSLFMLIHREDLRDRIIAVVAHGDYVTTTEALDEVAHRISRYLIAQTMINTSYGIILAIGLSLIGATMTSSGVFPNAFLWGLLATCLRFVPYVGPISAAAFPLAIAASVFPGYGVFLAVLVFIVTIELLSNNVLEPWLYGASTGISAVAVIVAAVFWGWLWGPVGLLLSTPLTVCLVVLGRHVQRFRILSTLLGDQVEISPSLRFYGRLLVGDQHRANELLQERLARTDYDETCDQVIIPALKRIRKDHNQDRLSDADANRLLALAGGLIAEFNESRDQTNDRDVETTTETNEEPATMIKDAERPTVIGCVSHHVSESLLLNLLRSGGREHFNLRTVRDDALPHEIAEKVVHQNPAVVVVTALPEGGFAQARFLCQSIRSEGYQGPIVVACFGKLKKFDEVFVQFRKAGATSMTSSFSQTRSKVESIVRRNAAAKSDQEPVVTSDS